MMRQNLVLVGLLRLPLLLLRLPMAMLKGSWAFLDDRLGIATIMEHPVPEEKGLVAWMYVFGSATLFSFLVAVVTGIPIASIYVPSSGEAYQSLLWLDHQAVLGFQLRGLHLISATAMFVLMGCHITRVFLTGAFKYPRELNWLTGTILLILTFFLLFTGQILRWDNFGLWTLAITASMTSRTPIIGHPLAYFLDGGPTWGGQTLPRLFTFHVFILPGLLFAVVGVHLYLVLREGISESPRAGRPVDPKTYRAWYHDLLKREGVPFWPDAGWRDAVFGVFVVFAIIAITLWFGPIALGGPPDPTNVNVQPRPDWYFIWYYAALALVPYTVENYAIIGAPVIFLAIMFALPFIANRGERVPTRRPWAVASVLLAGLMIVSLIETGDKAPWSPRFATASLPMPAAITTGLSGPALDGAKLWRSYGCVLCHMVRGYGGIRGPDLTNISNQLTPDELTIRILNGGYNMPQYGGIMSPIQLNDIVAFLETRRNVLTPGLAGSLQASSAQFPPPARGGKKVVAGIAHPTWSDVHKIFAANCTPCHIQQNLAGLDLNTYQTAMKGGSVAAGGVLTGRVIKPGNAKASFLYQAITGTQKLGARMPLGRAPLPAADIQTIYNWIQQGAKK